MELLVFGHGGTALLVFPASKVSLVLATGEQDLCLHDNVLLTRMLEEKGVPRLLDVWKRSSTSGSMKGR